MCIAGRLDLVHGVRGVPCRLKLDRGERVGGGVRLCGWLHWARGGGVHAVRAWHLPGSCRVMRGMPGRDILGASGCFERWNVLALPRRLLLAHGLCLSSVLPLEPGEGGI